MDSPPSSATGFVRFSESDVLEALRVCFDTGNPFKRPLSIVDLGMVETVTISIDADAPGAGIEDVPPRFRLAVELVPCTLDDDANSILVAQVENRIAGLPEISRTRVTLLSSPVWTPERIEPGLRSLLKLDPPTFPILNNR